MIKFVPDDKRFLSPDKKFSVELLKSNYEFLFLVTDQATGQTNQFSTKGTLIFALEWSPDSQTFVAVDHFAHTSCLELVHWDGKSWSQFSVGSQDEDYDNSHVVNWAFKKGYIKATYLLDHLTDNRRSVSCYRSTFHVDPVTGQISDIKKTAISPEEYASLRTGRN